MLAKRHLQINPYLGRPILNFNVDFWEVLGFRPIFVADLWINPLSTHYI